jgi:transcriptional regulator with XRE-family HTH domain
VARVTPETKRQGERIQALRVALGVSKPLMASRLGFESTQSLELYERGISVIRLDQLHLWAEAFEMAEVDFVNERSIQRPACRRGLDVPIRPTRPYPGIPDRALRSEVGTPTAHRPAGGGRGDPGDGGRDPRRERSALKVARRLTLSSRKKLTRGGEPAASRSGYDVPCVELHKALHRPGGHRGGYRGRRQDRADPQPIYCRAYCRRAACG